MLSKLIAALDSKRAQSAMEYLMTYGWAILVLLVVVAVLFAVGFSDTGQIDVPGSCSFQQGATCIEHAFYSETGESVILFGQSLGHPIEITNVKCTQEASSPADPSWTWGSGFTGSRISPGGSEALTLQCYDSDGAPVSGLNPSDYYSGKIWIQYTETDTGEVKVMSGQICASPELGAPPPTSTPTPTLTSTPAPTATPTVTPTTEPTATPTATPICPDGCECVPPDISPEPGINFWCYDPGAGQCAGPPGPICYNDDAGEGGVCCDLCPDPGCDCHIDFESDGCPPGTTECASGSSNCNYYSTFVYSVPGMCCGAPTPTATPTPTLTPTPEPLVISVCDWSQPPPTGSLIESPGNYVVESSLTAPSTCIRVLPGGAGSVIDCQGNSITGLGIATGVELYSGADGVTVHDCHVTQFTTGFSIRSNDNVLTDNSANYNTQYGFELVTNSGNQLTGNTAEHNTYHGFYFDTSSANTLTGNTASSSGSKGFYIYRNSVNNVLTGNTADSNTQDGFHLDDGCIGNNLSGNNALFNGGQGFKLEDAADDNNLFGNNASHHSSSGFAVISSCTGNTLENNNAFNNSYAIQLSYSNDNDVLDNTLLNSTSRGITISHSNSNIVEGNNISTYYDRGINVESSSSSNFIRYNTITDGRYGILVDSSTVNTISGNVITLSGYYGIYLRNSASNNILTYNTANNTLAVWGNGIYIKDSSGCTIENNIACNNAGSTDIACNVAQTGGDNICDSVSCSGASCTTSCPP